MFLGCYSWEEQDNGLRQIYDYFAEFYLQHKWPYTKNQEVQIERGITKSKLHCETLEKQSQSLREMKSKLILCFQKHFLSISRNPRFSQYLSTQAPSTRCERRPANWKPGARQSADFWLALSLLQGSNWPQRGPWSQLTISCSSAIAGLIQELYGGGQFEPSGNSQLIICCSRTGSSPGEVLTLSHIQFKAWWKPHTKKYYIFLWLVSLFVEPLNSSNVWPSYYLRQD